MVGTVVDSSLIIAIEDTLLKSYKLRYEEDHIANVYHDTLYKTINIIQYGLYHTYLTLCPRFYIT